MPAINFKSEFAHLVERGEKKQTIRPLRQTPIRPGDKLILYTGQRTKGCRRLLQTVAKEVIPIEIRFSGVRLNGNELSIDQRTALANADGFADDEGYFEFINFFKQHYELPFKGVLIKWGEG